MYPYSKDITLRERLALFVACQALHGLGWSQTPELELTAITLTGTGECLCETDVVFSLWGGEELFKGIVSIQYYYASAIGNFFVAKEGQAIVDDGIFRVVSNGQRLRIEYGIG
ncbi:MAG TPA: hypothetical protein VMQ44_02940 [Candidatus Saccharimonadales bacterium]|nr:hypothetical protein [Candidatus Saccharimonadales bacterium]